MYSPMYTVWEFRNVAGTEKKRVLRRTEVGESAYQHEYQRIIFVGDYQEAKKWL